MNPSCSTPSVALSIAGSDNSAGAGIQADLKTLTAHGVYGLTAVTCVVAEVPGRVSMVEPMPPKLVGEQIRLNFNAFPVAAVKTGMLFSEEIILEVCAQLKALPKRPWLVVDPVMVATSGDALLRPDAVRAYREWLFPMADLVTPNLDEARILAEDPIATPSELEAAGKKLQQQYGAAFLMKGGHFKTPEATDLLVTAEGANSFSAPYLEDIDTHGSGCTYSAAITAALALGADLGEAVASAKEFITRAITQHHRWRARTQTTDALNHFGQTQKHSPQGTA